MENLLLITDVSRIQQVFALLADDPALTVRVAASLEQGGAAIAAETPDIVFIQTHMSGISADILLIHLKKQLRGAAPQFVLMAAGQPNAATLDLFQGWLDIAHNDHRILADLQHQVKALRAVSHPAVEAPLPTEPPSIAGMPVTEEVCSEYPQPNSAPRSRLSVYSEFSASFDHAVHETPEAEPLDSALRIALPAHKRMLDAAERNPETSATSTKKVPFWLWLVLVVSAVVAVTLYQQRQPSDQPTTARRPADGKAIVTAARQNSASSAATARTTAAVMPPLSSITAPPPGRRIALPAFIPSSGQDTAYSTTHPGWERYAAQGIEYRVYRTGDSVKALQILALDGAAISRTFLTEIVRQLTGNLGAVIESSERADGYRIERGRLSDSIRLVYYRDEQEQKLRAIVLTWH